MEVTWIDASTGFWLALTFYVLDGLRRQVGLALQLGLRSLAFLKVKGIVGIKEEAI